jgi:4-alpha-glucanotransferase
MPPLWGVAAQLYGLRRTGDGGIGDYSALARLAVESAKRGAHALAVSPTHAMFSAEPERFSPYSPSSRLWLNVTHIDVEAVFGAQAARAAIEAAQAGDTWTQLERLNLIDWPKAVRLKLKVLRTLFEQFCVHDRAQDAPLALEFNAFCVHGGRSLEDHARFEALQAVQLAQAEPNGHWRNWPEALRNPRSAEVEAFANANRHEVEFYLFLQWLAAKGLSQAQLAARDAGMAVGLIADLAVGCDSAGSHAWSYRDDMLQGVSVGAPPDLFNQAGQAWGLTTFSPRAMRTQGFSAFIDMLRAAFAHAGGVRIDHILGLRRLWLVPDGESAANGAYLRYPLEDMLRLIALESWRHRSIVIGEDLGTVPPGFRERLDEHGIEGIRVLWFEGSEWGKGFVGIAMQWARPPPTTCRPSPDGGAAPTSPGATASARPCRAPMDATLSKWRKPSVPRIARYCGTRSSKQASPRRMCPRRRPKAHLWMKRLPSLPLRRRRSSRIRSRICSRSKINRTCRARSTSIRTGAGVSCCRSMSCSTSRPSATGCWRSTGRAAPLLQLPPRLRPLPLQLPIPPPLLRGPTHHDSPAFHTPASVPQGLHVR